MDKLLEKLETYLLYAIVFVFPIAVLSFFSHPYIVIKLVVLTFGIALILLVKSIRTIVSGKLEFSSANLDLTVLILLLAYLLSTIVRSQNKMEAFLLPGTTTIVVGGALLYYLMNQLRAEQKRVATGLLFASGVIFATVVLLASLGLFAKIPQLPNFMKLSSFNPEGGFLPGTIFLVTLIPIGVSFVFSKKEVASKVLLATANLVVILAVAIGIYNLLPGMPSSPKFLSFGTSWSIAVDALKEQPFLGVGPGNYITAFNRFRPIIYNNTDIWAIKYATANDFYLTLLTETGILGAVSIFLLLFAVYKIIRNKVTEKPVKWDFANDAPFVSLVVLLSLLIIFPTTTLLTLTIFVLLSLGTKARKTTINLSAQAVPSEADVVTSTQKVASRLPALLVTLPIIIGVIAFSYYASRILLAEYKFKKGLDALLRNEAVPTYDLMRQAITLNPYVDRYHATYSRVNLALVSAIATKKDITDQDRANVAQLVQQAIGEAKANVALNPLRSANWELLARTYMDIIPLTSGADAFAIQSIRQAVVLDPINPLLRISLGGLYYAKGDFDNATRVFELAVATKPDFANSHYNLAFALRDSGKIDQAISEMSLVLSLMDRASPDYEVAKKALEGLQEKKKAQAPTGEELTPPQPGEEPTLVPPIELPEESQPPEAPIPSPTPGAEEEGEFQLSPTSTPTPTPAF